MFRVSSELDSLLGKIRAFIEGATRDELSLKKFSAEQVERSVNAFYEMQGRRKPQIVWFQNPWQLLYGPGVFKNYKRKQIRLQDFQTQTCNSVRQTLEKEIGENETKFLAEYTESLIQIRDLARITNMVTLHIDVMENRPDARKHALQTMKQQLAKVFPDAPVTPDLDLCSREQFGWYPLEAYTGQFPPWEHLQPKPGLQDWTRRPYSELMDMSWGNEFNMERRRIQPVTTAPPGYEWSHFLRMQMAFPAIVKQFIGVQLSDADDKAVPIFYDLARKVSAIACFPEVCFLCEAPTVVRRDANNLFHAEDGPALVYDDSFTVYCWHNTRVEGETIEGVVTLERIMSEQNLEAMRVLMERYGIERYLQESGATHIHEDETGTLYRLGEAHDRDQESIMLVAVTNATPEADGSFKRYFLRVPPTTRTARQGVAWTFNLLTHEYRPTIES